jgi:two-component system, OmpR family, sensor histidine kinase ChvG
MSLRAQLLAIALLTLVLPWAGWRYVTEMEGALRGGLEQSLLASAATMASAFDDPLLFSVLPAASHEVETTIYAHPLDTAPRINGYGSDWNLGPEYARTFGSGHRYWVGVHQQRHLYLLLEVSDDTLVYQRSPTATPYGDRVVLNLGGTPERWLLLHTAAPGEIRARYTSPAEEFAPTERYEERVLATWVQTPGGYAVEMRMPLDMLAARPVLGVAVIDVRPAGAGFAAELEASWDLASGRPGALLHRPSELAQTARRFAQPGRRLRIVDANGWVLYDAGALEPVASVDDGDGERVARRGAAETLLRFILGRDDPPYASLEQPPGYLADETLRAALTGERVASWYRRGAEASAVVAAAVPVAHARRVGGAVIIEQGSDAILTLTNEALVRLMSFTLLASVVAAGALLGYATILSLRVRGLARAAETALTPRGHIQVSLPGENARDEIGDLARSFTDLLKRLRGYTDYLQTLKGKLAHELRTPLAVVSTSLDNLEREPHGEHLTPYLKRLREGSTRLDGIINAMSEATAIEQAVTDAPSQRFDLVPVVRSCVSAYRDIHPDRLFRLSCSIERFPLLGSPDLIAQMLDKLIDNAVSFSEPGSAIELALEEVGGSAARLSVSNRGPALPATMRAQLFDSLVSVRARGEGERRHLGLGLYIVSLIVRFHHGHVEADDLEDGGGVVFRLTLPDADMHPGAPRALPSERRTD